MEELQAILPNNGSVVRDGVIIAAPRQKALHAFCGKGLFVRRGRGVLLLCTRGMDSAPLILTLVLDDATQLFFNGLRAAHFPPERNYLDAHCTLFHHLPPGEETEIHAHLNDLASQTSSFAFRIAPSRSIGRGVIFPLEADALIRLHRALQVRWQKWLTPQDRQGLRPHVTVQNKVSAEKATATLDALLRNDSARPEEGFAVGLSLFCYRNGPWEAAGQIPFQDQAAA